MSEALLQLNSQAGDNLPDQESRTAEYVVKRVAGYEGHGKRRRNTAQCYGYGSEEDTREPAKNTPQHLIIQYSEQENRKRAGDQTSAARWYGNVSKQEPGTSQIKYSLEF